MDNFERGQVWYWRDPVYGSKGDTSVMWDVPVGESVLHFSRYVLIVQATELIDTYSMLVVPLSSRRHYITDPELTLRADRALSNRSYARCKSLFSVSPMQLQYMVTKISDTEMTAIDIELARVLGIEKMSRSMSDIYQQEVDEIESQRDIVPIIDQFIDDCVSRVPGNYVTASTALKLFQVYCDHFGYNNFYAVTTFLEEINDKLDLHLPLFMNLPMGRLRLEGIAINIRDLDRVKIGEMIDMPVVEEAAVDDGAEIVVPKKKGRKARWTDESKQGFVEFYEAHGRDEACDEYGISGRTAYKYYRDFKKEVADIAIEEVEVNPTTVAEGLLALRDYMVGYAKASGLFNSMGSCVITPSKKKKNRKIRISADRFYHILNDAIFVSLLDALDIRNHDDPNMFWRKAVEIKLENNPNAVSFVAQIPKVKDGMNCIELKEQVVSTISDIQFGYNWSYIFRKEVERQFGKENIMISEHDIALATKALRLMIQ